MKRFMLTLALGSLFGSVSRPAWADVMISERQESLADGKVSTTRIYVTPDRVRVETESEDGNHAFIFLGSREVFLTVDYRNRTYIEMTTADMEQMTPGSGDSIAASQQQLEEQLEGLPEAQRRIIEQTLGGQIPQAPPAIQLPETEYRLVGSGEQVGEWTAELFEGTESGVKRWDVWTVEWSQVDLSDDDFQAFERLAAMMERMMPAGSQDFIHIPGSDGGPGYSGFPVRRVSYENGEPTVRFEINEIVRDTIDPGLFAAPPSFSRQSNPTF